MYQSDFKHDSQSLEDKLHFLYRLNRDKTIDLGFRSAFLYLLKAFGNPHLSLPPVIHVAGTNGKGSTIAFLQSIYEAAGLRVHTYTSPHLVRFNERIVLAGQQIDDETLESLIDETLDLNAGRDCTFFEATTAMAFAAFSRVPADLCLLEVGLGGRLDCTNVIEDPTLCVITPVGMDHMEFLGGTLAEIAAEKAGILKSGVPCVIAPQEDAAMGVIEDVAEKVGSPIIPKHTGQSVCSSVALLGAHQVENARTALRAVEALQDRFAVTEDALERGLKAAQWPARLQPLKIDGRDVILDGGHNAEAGQVVADYIASLEQPVNLVFCMMKHKDPQAYLGPLLPHLASITTTQIPDEPASLGAEELRDLLDTDLPIQTSQDYRGAIAKCGDGIILIAGSLYLAGRVLKDLENSAHT